MATHTLTENYRASKAVLDYVNKHKPSGKGSLTQCDGDDGLVCPPEPCAGQSCTSAGPHPKSCTGLPDAPAVAQQIINELTAKSSVAVLCRTNNQVRQWQTFLENWEDPSKSGTKPLNNKTRLIEDDAVKVHRLWPIWWFFHGYQHLHPVPSDHFHDWCNTLGLVNCSQQPTCTCAGKWKDDLSYPAICAIRRQLLMLENKISDAVSKKWKSICKSLYKEDKDINYVINVSHCPLRSNNEKCLDCNVQNKFFTFKGNSWVKKLEEINNSLREYAQCIGSVNVSKIKSAPYDCPKRQQINGRISDLTPLTFGDAIQKLKDETAHHTQYKQTISDWLSTPSLNSYLKDYKAQWEEMLKNLSAEHSSGQMVTWAELWYKFEEYFNEIENHLPKNKVILSTIHKAKGCEFDSVFLWDWECKKDTEDDETGVKASELPGALKDDCYGVFYKSTVDSEKKVFYVGCSRPRKNLFVLKPNMSFSCNGSAPQLLATPDMVTNIFALKPAFDYKDISKGDWTTLHTNKSKPFMVENWNQPANSVNELTGALKSGEKKHYCASSKDFSYYFQDGPHGAIPQVLPVVSELLLTVKKNNGYSVTVNKDNHSDAANELRKMMYNGEKQKHTFRMNLSGSITSSVDNGGYSYKICNDFLIIKNNKEIAKCPWIEPSDEEVGLWVVP